jgi:hypothetical protein
MEEVLHMPCQRRLIEKRPIFSRRFVQPNEALTSGGSKRQKTLFLSRSEIDGQPRSDQSSAELPVQNFLFMRRISPVMFCPVGLLTSAGEMRLNSSFKQGKEFTLTLCF